MYSRENNELFFSNSHISLFQPLLFFHLSCTWMSCIKCRCSSFLLTDNCVKVEALHCFQGIGVISCGPTPQSIRYLSCFLYYQLPIFIFSSFPTSAPCFGFFPLFSSLFFLTLSSSPLSLLAFQLQLF